MAAHEAVKQLLQKYLAGACDENEQTIVEAWYQEQVLQDSWDFSSSDDPQLGERMLTKLRERLHHPQLPLEPAEGITPFKPAGHHKVRLIHFRRHWVRYAAACILLAGAGIWLITKHTRDQPDQRTGTFAQLNDIAPGTNKAVLTLANGKQISLDSNAAGLIALQGNTTIVQAANGRLELQTAKTSGEKAPDVLYNSLSTPIGGQYQLRLPDGSKVWLNALTTIRFPSWFNDTNREVHVDGEAYFEVVKDEQHPFHVVTSDVNIEVLGTAFNVNSYNDEPAIRTSLLQGAVRVTRGNSRFVMQPGEQVQTTDRSGLALVKDADVEKAIAWKNGSFSFDNDNIQTIMRQLSKWYDIDVRYQGEPPHTIFGGNMRRTLSLKQVLAGLSKYDVHFRLEGRTLFVMP